MKKKLLSSKVKGMMETAKECLISDGYILPVVMAFKFPDCALPVALAGPAAKKTREVSQLMLALGWHATVTVTESWIAMFRPDEEGMAPSQLPPDRRSECIAVCGRLQSGHEYRLFVVFHRQPDGTIVFDEPVEG